MAISMYLFTFLVIAGKSYKAYSLCIMFSLKNYSSGSPGKNDHERYHRH